MTFSEPRVNVIESSAGYSVEVLDRTYLLYREGDRSARVGSEILSSPIGLVMYASTLKRWEPPHEQEAVDDVERRRILDNIQKAFQWKGYDCDVIWPATT
jgi:hypothetical protein